MKQTDFQKYFLNMLRGILERNRTFLYKITEQSDRIIVWLVGFSIATIALSISNESNLTAISNDLPKTIIFFSSLTIIIGVLYRIFLFIAQGIEVNLLISFEGYIEGYNNPPDFPSIREVQESDTYEEIIEFIKEDFDITLEKLDTTRLNDEQLKLLKKSVFEYYRNLNKFSNDIFENDINELRSVLSTYLGYSNRKLDKIFKPKKSKINPAKVCWFFHRCASVFFLLTTFSFLTGLITFLLHYY